MENSEQLRALGLRIKLRRTELGLSQFEAAADCDIERSFFSSVERGLRNPSFLLLLKVCKGLKTDIATLTKDITL